MAYFKFYVCEIFGNLGKFFFKSGFAFQLCLVGCAILGETLCFLARQCIPLENAGNSAICEIFETILDAEYACKSKSNSGCSSSNNPGPYSPQLLHEEIVLREL